MSANVFGERFLGYREPAWHHLGTVFTERMLVRDAVLKAGLGYNVIKTPLTAYVTQTVGKNAVSVPVEIPDQVGIVREPTPDDDQFRFFGTASANYEIVQNIDLGTILDQVSGDWPVETVGALGFGETIFITLDAGVLPLMGRDKEEIHQYFLVTDTKDGKTAMRIAFTPVRVVCQNTLITGISQASALSQLPHLQGMDKVLDFRVKLMAKINAMKDSTMDVFAMLSKTALDAGSLAEIVNVAYPYPVRPKKAALLDNFTEGDALELGDLYGEANNAQQVWEYYCSRVDVHRTGAMTNLFRMNDEHPHVANTAWAAYNAVVENEDFRDGPETLFASALWGDRARAKIRAFKASKDMAESQLAADIKRSTGKKARK